MEKVKIFILFFIFTLSLYSEEIENLLIIKNIEENIENPIEETIFFLNPEIEIKNTKKEYYENKIKAIILPFINKKIEIEKNTLLELQKKETYKYKKENISKNLNLFLEHSLFYNDYSILKTNFLLFNNYFKNQLNINIDRNDTLIFDKIDLYFNKFLFSNIILFNYTSYIKYIGNSFNFQNSFKNNYLFQSAFANYIIDKNFFNAGLDIGLKIDFFNIQFKFYYHESFYYGLLFRFNYKGFNISLDNFFISDFSSIYKYRFNIYFYYTNNLISIKLFKLDKNIIEWTKNYYSTLTETKFINYEIEINKEKLYKINSIAGIEFLLNYKIFSLITNSILFFEEYLFDINFNLPINIQFFNNYSSIITNFNFNKFLFKNKIYFYFFKEIKFKYGINIYFEEIEITKNFKISSGIIFDIENNTNFLLLFDNVFLFIPFNLNKLYFGFKIGTNIENTPIFNYKLESGFKINF